MVCRNLHTLRHLTPQGCAVRIHKIQIKRIVIILVRPRVSRRESGRRATTYILSLAPGHSYDWFGLTNCLTVAGAATLGESLLVH